MPHFNPNEPWLFHRSEVDLLEEEIDEIYQLFYEENRNVRTMEQSLIQEQIDTEELAEAELAFKASSITTSCLFANIDESETELFPGQKTSSVRTVLQKSVLRNPFYEQVFVWANALFLFAKDVYEKHDECSQDAFRVFLNVKVIPVKILNAMEEEGLEEPFAVQVAEKEYRLAFLYLERILSSLANMALLNHSLPIDPFFIKGRAFKQILEKILVMFLRRKQRGFPSQEDTL